MPPWSSGPFGTHSADHDPSRATPQAARHRGLGDVDQASDSPCWRRTRSRYHIRVRIACQGFDASQYLAPHRWVVERTLAWRNHLRGLTRAR